MTSKAERKRRKKAATISLPGGESVPQRIEGAGRPRKMAEDPRKTALQARCRRSEALMPKRAVEVEMAALKRALALDDQKAKREAVEAVAKRVEDLRMKAANDPKLVDSVGRLILTEPEAKRADLWNATQHARATQLAYDRAIGAPNRHAQVARILSPVAAFEADASSPAPDYRTEEDKFRQAVAAQMRVEGWIGHTDSRAASAFKQAVINDPDGPVRDWPGVLACLQCVSEGIKGQPVKVRVR